MDVFVSGYAFRLKIWHERGLNLLKKESKNPDTCFCWSIDRLFDVDIMDLLYMQMKIIR